MPPEPTNSGSPVIAKVVGALFLLVFTTAGVGMAIFAHQFGAPWFFSLVPGGMALIGLCLLVALLFKRDAGPAPSGPAPGTPPTTPTTPTPASTRRCRYCGRPAQGPEVICAGCQGPVDG